MFELPMSNMMKLDVLKYVFEFHMKDLKKWKWSAKKVNGLDDRSNQGDIEKRYWSQRTCTVEN